MCVYWFHEQAETGLSVVTGSAFSRTGACSTTIGIDGVVHLRP